MKGLMDLFHLGRDQVRLSVYRAASQIHWPPREDAFRRAYDSLSAEGVVRLLDIGCGPGWLAETARDLGVDYVGIDADPAAIAYAKARFHSKQAQFIVGDSASLAALVNNSDVAILNGVCHHLEDAELMTVLTHLRTCQRVFILDHQFDHLTSRLNRILQIQDKGRYVRSSAFFETLPAYRRVYLDIFPIRLVRATLWRYFCAIYIPEHRSHGT